MQSADIETTRMTLAQRMMAESGKKSSSKFVEDADRALRHAQEQGWITDDLLVQMARAFKKASLESVAKAKDVYALGTQKRAVNSREDMLAQYVNSTPQKSREKYLNDVITFIRAMEIAIADTGGDRKCLQWGTLVRTKVYASTVVELASGMVEYVIPPGKWALQGLFVYNGIDSDLAFRIIDPHLKCTIKFLKLVHEKQGFDWIQPGSVIPGSKNFKSTNGQWHLNAAGRALIPTSEDASFLQPKGEKLAVALASDNLQLLLAAATVIDVRVILQTSNYKQLRTPTVLINVASWMSSIIKVTEGNKVTPEVDVNSGTPFTTLYYLALGKLRATIRSCNAQVYGKKGGADTRSGKTTLPKGATLTDITGFTLAK